MRLRERRKDTPLAVDNEGKNIYILSSHCSIQPLVLACDGVRVTRFGKENKVYVLVKDVIAWHEKELKESGGASGSREALEGARKILAKFKSGDFEENPKPNGCFT